MNHLEKLVLYSMATDPIYCEIGLEKLTDKDFQDPDGARCFKKCWELKASGSLVDPTLLSEFGLAGLEGKPLYFSAYLREIKSRSLKKQLEKYLLGEVFEVHKVSEAVDAIKALQTNSTSLKSHEDMKKYIELLGERRKLQKDVFKTGIVELDNLSKGFRRKRLIIVGARTSIGKTTFLSNICLQSAMGGKRVLYLTGEMGEDEIMDKFISQMTKQPLLLLADGDIDPVQLAVAAKKLSEKNITIIKCGRIGTAGIEKFIMECKPDVLFIDYFQLLSEGKNNNNRARELSDIASSIKSMTIKYDITIFAASQFNRDIESRPKRIPILADFKESGGLEEAADMAILLWPEVDDQGNEVDIINARVAKNRHGRTTLFQMVIMKDIAKIRSLEGEPNEM